MDQGHLKECCNEQLLQVKSEKNFNTVERLINLLLQVFEGVEVVKNGTYSR